MVELEEGEFIIDIEEGYRTTDVEGAIVTSMGIVESEKGGMRSFIDFDDGKGMATYNMIIKGEPIGNDGEPDHKVYPGYLDIGKIISSLKANGYISIQNPTKKTWRTDPPIVGQPVWIKCVKTSTDKDGKEYKSLIEVTKIGSDDTPKSTPAPKGSTPAKSTPKQTPPVKGALTPELLESWKEVLGKVLTEPLNEIGINTAIKKAYPEKTDEVFRKSLADVRTKALAALLITDKNPNGILEMDENAKYSISV